MINRTEEEIEEARERYNERVNFFMDEYGMRFRSATGLAGEMEYIENKYGYYEIESLVKSAMLMAYRHGKESK